MVPQVPGPGQPHTTGGAGVLAHRQPALHKDQRGARRDTLQGHQGHALQDQIFFSGSECG